MVTNRSFLSGSTSLRYHCRTLHGFKGVLLYVIITIVHVCMCVFVGRAASREVVRGAGGEADRAGEPLPEAAGSCSLQTPGY